MFWEPRYTTIPLTGVGRGGGGISFEVSSVSKVMLSYSQRARVAVAKMRRRMMLKTCAVPGEKIKENKRKGKLFKVKIYPKMLSKNVRQKNTDKSPVYKARY
jgi:hypothetical protein